MAKKEEQHMERGLVAQLLPIFSGILFHSQMFAKGKAGEIRYRFDCPEFVTLKEKYGLEEIAGKGSDFRRAKRLLHYLAPKLTHSPWYDNHVPVTRWICWRTA